MNKKPIIKKLNLSKEQKNLMSNRIKLDYNQKKWAEKDYGNYFKTILLFITNQCDVGCKHCFYKNNLNNLKQMSFEYIKKIVDNNPEVSKYDIMGGEPLLHPEFEKIFDYLESKNKKIGLYTNGFLLDRFPKKYKKVRINIAFHAIDPGRRSSKSISDIRDNVRKYEFIYPTKLVFLLTKNNYKLLGEFAIYIENNFKNINKLTIGAVRDEQDYYNDNIDNILPLEEYCKIIQNFINNYNGPLDIDIFGEGILYTDKLPQATPNQLNRFKCIFPDNEYSACLYDIGVDKKIKFNPDYSIPFSVCEKCPKTGKRSCLTDKIKLKKLK